jgi:AraC family transcriptional regulator, regulatory protein of adaptative response / methylated-DNA-[protein]-cysteine methyltransferase
MTDQQQVNYTRIAEAIEYIGQHYTQQPDLDRVAQQVHLSPFHFQRLFTDWVGISPKKFLQFISVEHAKSLLKNQQSSLLETADRVGLSGTGRLHDLFINIEGMTPAEFKQGGKNLDITYQFADTLFGSVLVANTPKGICHLAFYQEKNDALSALHREFPHATFVAETHPMQENALRIFRRDWDHLQQVKLHLKGTAFQLKIWEALLKIPAGQLSTYGRIATTVGNPAASRAVGTAIGSNPVAFLIPCHRVIQASGHLGGYMWGTTRKKAIIGWEMAQLEQI